MKKIILLLAFFTGYIFTETAKAQQTAKPDPTAPVITFERDTIDYGTIAHNADGYRYFKFTNTGKSPLLISSVRSSCGCLVATWPQYPIQPGQSDKIRAHYATDRIGRFRKTLTMTSNANPPIHILWIQGNVLPDPVQSTVTSK
jgi:hypothetical protein